MGAIRPEASKLYLRTSLSGSLDLIGLDRNGDAARQVLYQNPVPACNHRQLVHSIKQAVPVFPFDGSVVWLASQLHSPVPRMSGHSEWLLEMHRNVRCLLAPRMLFPGVLLSVIAWFAECLVLYFAMFAYQCDAGPMQATLIYALSTLAGALSIMPGGLVATEGSMAGLLLYFGLGRDLSSTLTFVVRACTLWFAVLAGMVFLTVLDKQERFHAKGSGCCSEDLARERS